MHEPVLTSTHLCDSFRVFFCSAIALSSNGTRPSTHLQDFDYRGTHTDTDTQTQTQTQTQTHTHTHTHMHEPHMYGIYF